MAEESGVEDVEKLVSGEGFQDFAGVVGREEWRSAAVCGGECATVLVGFALLRKFHVTVETLERE